MASNPDIFLQNLIGTTGLAGRTIMEQENNQLAQAQARQGLQLGQLKLGAAQQQVQRQAQYQADVNDWISKGSPPEGLLALSARYPEQAEQAVNAWKIKDDATKGADLSYYGRVHNAANNNRPDLVVGLLRQRRDAEKARGVDTSEADQMLAMLESPNEEDKKQALATIKGWSLIGLSAADPVRFAQNNKAVGGEVENGFTLSPGARRFDKDGKLLAEAPFAPRPVTVGEGQTVVEYDPNTGGGGQASSGSGGGGNGDPYNTVVGFGTYGKPPKPLTSMSIGEVIQFGRDTLIPNTKAQGVGRDARGTLGSSAAGAYQITGETLRKYGPRVLGDGWQNQPFTPQVQDRIAEAIFHDNKEGNLKQTWAALPDSRPGAYKDVPWQQMRAIIRQAEVGGGQGGGSRVIAQGGVKPGYRILAPEELPPNLDPNITYQQSPDGQITPVGGQRQGQLKQWPAAALQARAEGEAAIRNVFDAAWLLDPKNKNDERAKIAQRSIGPGTGALGDTFTQWNDPKGAAFRAQLGQIGGIIIKDTSGAAVSLSEDARLSKWVPLVTDTPTVARAKLKNLERELRARQRVFDETYSEENGFRPFRQNGGQGSGSVAPVRVRSLQQARALKPGTRFIDPNGVERVR